MFFYTFFHINSAKRVQDRWMGILYCCVSYIVITLSRKFTQPLPLLLVSTHSFSSFFTEKHSFCCYKKWMEQKLQAIKPKQRAEWRAHAVQSYGELYWWFCTSLWYITPSFDPQVCRLFAVNVSLMNEWASVFEYFLLVFFTKKVSSSCHLSAFSTRTLSYLWTNNSHESPCGLFILVSEALLSVEIKEITHQSRQLM